MEHTFAAAINCMDGRVQQPVIEFMTSRYGVEYVDMITEPGPNKVLAAGDASGQIASIKRRVEISVNNHGSKVIAIFGHEDCAGNPAAKEEQVVHLKKAAEQVCSWGLDVEQVETFWVSAPFSEGTISAV